MYSNCARRWQCQSLRWRGAVDLEADHRAAGRSILDPFRGMARHLVLFAMFSVPDRSILPGAGGLGFGSFSGAIMPDRPRLPCCWCSPC
ncbi:hypothetical protein ACHWUR_00365 [Klebsiella pneumoniae]